MARMMRAAVFAGPGRIALGEKPVPEVGPLDALVRVTTTTICGTDVHILKGEYPVVKGLTQILFSHGTTSDTPYPIRCARLTQSPAFSESS